MIWCLIVASSEKEDGDGLDGKAGQKFTSLEGVGTVPLEVGDEGREFNFGVVSLFNICASFRSSDFVVDFNKVSNVLSYV